ncbi:MAG: hypothetical protein WDA60_14560 [Acidimicrobiia bacterium]|jgi:hypothetical protein
MVGRALRVLSVATIAVVAIAGTAGTGAAAESGDVVVAAAPVQLVAGTGGSYTAEVGVTNKLPGAVVVRAAIPDAGSCTVIAAPDKIEARRSATVKLTLDRGCAVEDATTPEHIRLTFVEEGTTTVVHEQGIKAKVPAADPEPDWEILGFGGLFGGGVTAITVVLVLIGIEKLKDENAVDPKRIETRKRAHVLQQQRDNEVRVALAQASEPVDLGDPGPPKIGWSTNLDGLTTGWSFKDNWVSNVTVGAAAVAAILAATDVLNAVLGKDEATAVVGLVTVVAAITLVLVLLGPLVLKAFGDDVNTPTIGGTVVAAGVVLAGTFFQIAALTAQGATLVEDDWTRLAIAAGGIVIAVVVMLYAARSVPQIIDDATTPKGPGPASPEERAAWIVFRGLAPTTVFPPVTPLDITQFLAQQEATALGDDPAKVTKRMASYAFAPPGNALL